MTAPHGRPEFWNLLKDADFYIGAGQFKHGPEFYSQAPKLKLVQTLSAGYNTYDLDAARAAGVPICNNGGANATAVAEHAIMLMLAVSRKLIWVHEGVVSGRWRGNDFNSAKLYELEDKTLGIIGLGNIGKKVARRAKAFDMRIQYYDINRMTTDQEDALGVRFVLLPELLKTSDYRQPARAARPVDAQSDRRARAGMMKKTAILINTCRGPVVDEVALYKALRDETIMAAGLDVMVEEPPKPDHELFTLKNAIFSPHSAGPTWDNHPKRWRNAFDNCERVARGQKAVLDRAGAAIRKRHTTQRTRRTRRGRDGLIHRRTSADPLRPLRRIQFTVRREALMTQINPSADTRGRCLSRCRSAGDPVARRSSHLLPPSNQARKALRVWSSARGGARGRRLGHRRDDRPADAVRPHRRHRRAGALPHPRSAEGQLQRLGARLWPRRLAEDARGAGAAAQPSPRCRRRTRPRPRSTTPRSTGTRC